MKMIIFSRALLLFDWHRQAIGEHYWVMFYRSFKETVFVLASSMNSSTSKSFRGAISPSIQAQSCTDVRK